MASVTGNLEIKPDGNATGANGNWRFRVDADFAFYKEKRKADVWSQVEKKTF